MLSDLHADLQKMHFAYLQAIYLHRATTRQKNTEPIMLTIILSWEKAWQIHLGVCTYRVSQNPLSISWYFMDTLCQIVETKIWCDASNKWFNQCSSNCSPKYVLIILIFYYVIKHISRFLCKKIISKTNCTSTLAWLTFAQYFVRCVVPLSAGFQTRSETALTR